MLRSLLLVGAGAASGWFAHRALGDRAHPATDGTDVPTSGPGSAGGRAGFSARLDPERLARQAGEAAADAATAALQDGARRLADRVRAQAPWAAPYLPHTGPIISGETVEPSSHGAARPQTTTTQKDTPA